MLRLLQVCRLPSTSTSLASINVCASTIRQFSFSSFGRFSRFQQNFRLNPQRRPVAAPKPSEGQQKVAEQLHPDQIPVRPARDLLKATLFAAGVGFSAYTIAAICEYDRMKRARNDVFNFFTEFSVHGILGQAKEVGESPLTPGQKAALAIIAINTVITLIWRIPRVQPTMYRYFTNSFASKSLCSPMLLSVFSHNNLIHLALNMYVLYSFTPVAIDRFLGVEQFVALYATSGVFSSLTSLAHKFATKNPVRALGASGAICALLAYTCMKIPDARLAIIFMPFIQFSAEQAVYGLIAFDLIGLIFRFRMFDHAAHLGGTMFGVLYAMYGEHWIRHHFNPKVFKACKKADKEK